jgi:glucose-1-phosphate thymidylyltransferase
MDENKDGVIWVSKIEDPRAFGVVKFNKENIITDFVEKPQTFVSDLAIIGIYYVKDGDNLRKEMQYLIDNDIKEKGEYQLTNALENMKNKGMKFVPGKVDEWLDCGNKDATVYTNKRVLEIHSNTKMISSTLKKSNAVVIEPCYIGEDVVINDSVVGPHVSIGSKTIVENSVITNSIIQNNSKVINAVIGNSMIGNFVEYNGKVNDLSIGDYSVQK